MGRRGGLIEPVQERVVVDVDEKLGASRFRTSSVGHGKSSRGIGDALVFLSNFIRDGSSRIALVGLSIASLELSSRVWASGSSASTVSVLGVRAAELVHEVRDDTVEVLKGWVQKFRT